MDDNFFTFLLATGELDNPPSSEQNITDEMLERIVIKIIELADDYTNGLIDINEVRETLLEIEKETNINYEKLYKIFKKNI